ncbi:hypothetical protein [Geotalea sp. SG265]|uniref:hypothetical protein n=1 Tax=Geotalea sp. SG265 TaxID=2922867 RepID=UPI001FAF946F|nr:hypothetical protein [Geotalea sp. SG265]
MAAVNDLVLVHIDNKPGFYARLEDISPDIKPGWWKVKLLVLTIPVQIYTWILDENQIDGAPFTMGGTPVQLEKVVSPEPVIQREGQENEKSGTEKKGAKVVSLMDRKKDK